MANINFTCQHCKQQNLFVAFPRADKSLAHSEPGLTTFQNTSEFISEIPESSTVIERRNFWASDAINYTLTGLFSGGVIAVYFWYNDIGNGSIVALVTLTGVIGLPILKLFLNRTRGIVEAVRDETIIRIESWDNPDGSKILLNEFNDKRITMPMLESVATAVIKNKVNFSRPALTKAAGISQGKYHALKAEFERLDFCYTDDGNRTHLLHRGKNFLRTVAK